MSQQLPHDFVPWNTEEVPQLPKKRKMKPGVKSALFSMAVILVLVIFLFGSLFRIRKVTVVGNQDYTPDQIMQEAGIQYGMSYFSVTEKKVRTAMEQNRYLEFRGMEKFIPGSVALYIRERNARANVQVMGITYLLDESGMVLEAPSNGLDSTLPIVTGMQSRNVMVGKTLVSGNENQMDAYRLLMEELLAQGYLYDIAELKVSDPENLYLLTRDGYTVHLGDGEELRAKIGTMRAVVMKLREMGHKGGVIDASVPAVATYTPSEI